jgi:tetratricopeptide (TPR) repeat protein
VGSLTALSLQSSGDRIVAEYAFSLAELDGQRLLPLDEQADAAEDYFTHAEISEQAGLFVEAAALYAHCAAVDTSDATAPFNQGNCLREADVLRQLGRPEAARAHLQRAVAVDPAYADAIYNLAALDYEMGNLDEAVAGWRRYLELDDSSDWARRARSGITLVSQMPRSQAG